MDDVGGVTVACEDVTSFNEGDDQVMMSLEANLKAYIFIRP
jgi:hypothetical protein